MRTRVLVLAVIGVVAAAAAASAKKGPALGVSSGPQGVLAPSGTVKYVAMGARRRGDTVVREASLPTARRWLQYPVTRAAGIRGWVYTLYGRDDKPAFVHALGTADRVAICIDLPWIVPRSVLNKVRMSMSPDG